MTNQRFAQALESMRSPDARISTRGFDFLREHADAYVDELIEEFSREQDDELRCWLLELISEARSPSALRVLAGELESDDESVQFWAIRGLEMLDTREARDELYQARTNGWIA
ncbi:HEAT repeat domain-containing protein [Actinomadura sp. DC4]|uniref:HEAT repeat domain-containing protein n=1 Tax=Actinomadura sp. DC4 TaxID=3055069 RepID=UPI0025AF7447|nr:HEAT repeat domain-containing protein [Actinomadura sp. DC4]MDN3351484.1 HEAT repeat domain-containing protein [Actinomadura sp. DC4]